MPVYCAKSPKEEFNPLPVKSLENGSVLGFPVQPASYRAIRLSRLKTGRFMGGPYGQVGENTC